MKKLLAAITVTLILMGLIVREGLSYEKEVEASPFFFGGGSVSDLIALSKDEGQGYIHLYEEIVAEIKGSELSGIPIEIKAPGYGSAEMTGLTCKQQRRITTCAANEICFSALPPRKAKAPVLMVRGYFLTIDDVPIAGEGFAVPFNIYSGSICITPKFTIKKP